MNLPQETGRARAAGAAAAIGFALAAAALALHAPAAPHVSASSGGRTGASGNPAQGGQTCARCHAGGETPTVSLFGPEQVLAGTTHAFTLTISGGQEAGGGLGVSVTDGLLLLPPEGPADVRVADNEVTHRAPKAADEDGVVTFAFLWRSPEEMGEVTFYAAGNSVDLDGTTSGDGSAVDTRVVAVMPAQATETPEPTAPVETPEPTAPPAEYEVVLADLNNPHGLFTLGARSWLVAEGGTGDPVPGQFAPGNGDGRVLEIGPMPEDRKVIVDDMTNALDPGGGIVGANHAIGYTRGLPGEDWEQFTLVAQAGGPGHLRPDESAKILKVTTAGTVTVLADTLAFEEGHNPGGEEGEAGIDSNPWRLAPHGEVVLVTDAGANDILTLDPVTGELGLFAVFEPIGDSQAIPTGIVVQDDVVYVALLGSMFSPAPTGQIRRLQDLNGDGDALDEGENLLFMDGLLTPTDLALGPLGHLFVLEMFAGTLARVDPACWDGGEPCEPDERQVMAGGLTAATALTWDDNFDALVTMGPRNEAGPSLRTDRVVRVPFTQTHPTPTPETPEPGTPTPATPTPDTPTPVPHGWTIFLPWVMNRG